jgi:hypothetical protein
MNETEARLKQEIEALLRRAEETDSTEDAQYGKDKQGDELPDELSRRESRLQKIREAKQALEEEALEKADQERAEAEKKQAEREEEALLQSSLPLRDLVRMNIELLRKFSQRLLPLQSCQGHLRFKNPCVIPAGTSRHRCSSFLPS